MIDMLHVCLKYMYTYYDIHVRLSHHMNTNKHGLLMHPLTGIRVQSGYMFAVVGVCMAHIARGTPHFGGLNYI